MPKITHHKMLVCEPQKEVTHYQIELNGQEQKPISALPDGSMSADLTGLSDGDHKVRVRAGCEWSREHIQWSDWSAPMIFKIFRPRPPGGLRTDVKEIKEG